MGGFTIVLDVICLSVGIYLIVSSAQMKKSGKVERPLLLSSDVRGKHCKNEKGFIQRAVPRVRIMAGCAIGYAVLEIINQLTIYNGILEWVITIILFAAFVWYSKESKKMLEEFF